MSRGRAGSGRDALGWVLIAVALAGFAAAAIGAWLVRPPPLDPATFCRTDHAPGAHVALLVDASNPLEPRHKKRLANAVETARQSLKPGDRMSILEINDKDPREPRVVASLCSPGAGREINPLLQSTVQAEARYQDLFAAPLRDAAERAGAGKRTEKATYLTDALVTLARDPDFASAASRRIVIVSDMLEHHAGGFSLYDPKADYAVYTRAPDAANPATLSGVRIDIVLIDRPAEEALQARAKETFWPDYFAAAGAAPVTWN